MLGRGARLIVKLPFANIVAVKPGQIRCGKHTDYGTVTLLFQDGVGGLEVNRFSQFQNSFVKSGPLRLKQVTNTLKIRILSETSILYLIRYASIILIVGLRL